MVLASKDLSQYIGDVSQHLIERRRAWIELTRQSYARSKSAGFYCGFRDFKKLSSLGHSAFLQHSCACYRPQVRRQILNGAQKPYEVLTTRI